MPFEFHFLIIKIFDFLIIMVFDSLIFLFFLLLIFQLVFQIPFLYLGLFSRTMCICKVCDLMIFV